MRRFLLTLVIAGSCLLLHRNACGVDPIVPGQNEIVQQNYAVIDASGTSTGGRDIKLVALTEDSQLKFAYKDSIENIGDVYTIKTWIQGSVIEAITRAFPLTVSYTGDDRHKNFRRLKPSWLTSDGVVYGESYWDETDDTSGPLFYCAGTQPNDPNLGSMRPIDIDFGNGLGPTLDHPYSYLGDTAYVDGMGPALCYVATNGTYCAVEYYEDVHDGQNNAFSPSAIGDEFPVEGDDPLHSSYDHFLCFTKNTTFDPHTYNVVDPHAGSPQDVSFPRRHDLFEPTVINGQGWCAGFQRPLGGTSTVLFWNASAQEPKECGAGTPVAISEANDLLIRGTASVDSSLIEKGDITHRRYFKSGSDDQRLIPKHLQTKVRNISPFAMSDRVTINSTVVHPILHILFYAEVCISIKDNKWALETFLLRLFSDESTDLHQIGSYDQATGAVSLNDGIVTISSFACINSSGVIAAIGNGGHALLLVPVDMQVDANRDGQIVPDYAEPPMVGAAPLPQDNTSPTQPYRFWINDDNDGRAESNYVESDGINYNYDGVEQVGSSARDYTLDTLETKRGLEDFTRLWLHLPVLGPVLQSGGVQIGLRWKPNPLHPNAALPKIKLFRAEKKGTDYLTDDASANTQVTFDPNHRGSDNAKLCPAIKSSDGKTVVEGGTTFVFTQQFWQDVGVSESKPDVYLLMEGVGDGGADRGGKGCLEYVYLDKDGHEYASSRGILYIDVCNIKNMYERAKATPPSINYPYKYIGPGTILPEPNMGCMQDPNGYLPDYSPVSWEQTKQYIVYVHGWKVDYAGATNTGETLFKRLWQRGYKGRFARFYWPTYTGVLTFNDSEYRAWKCGSSLQQYTASLPSGYTKDLISHSMGGIVGGSALQKGMSVDNYVLLNAAIPAECFDTNSVLNQPDMNYATPDDESDTRALGYIGKLSTVSANLVNFYLTQDKATTFWWPLNQENAKPQILAGDLQYCFTPSNPDGQKLRIVYVDQNGIVAAVLRSVTTAHEAMAYVDQSKTKATGGESRTRGAIQHFSNMDNYNFRTNHSAQWDLPIQKTQFCYYDILDNFGIPQIYLDPAHQ